MESILKSIKALLGIQEEQDNFDTELIMHINSALFVLNQLAVGPKEGFRIVDEKETWVELVGNRDDIEIIKSCVFLRVKIIFDPPATSYLITNLKEQLEEYEWRLNIHVESNEYEESEVTAGSLSGTGSSELYIGDQPVQSGGVGMSSFDL